jgi:prepilin-type N-terminal cleavage/methylation domain-containing protein
MSKTKSGFTIVELLIVIVVIGILATITIVAYNGIQERARVSSVSSALSQAAKKVAVWQVDNVSASPTCTNFNSLLDSTGSSCSFSKGDIDYQYTAGTSGAYCVTATAGSTSYKITESTKPTTGGCAGHGVGGVAAVTNLVANPSFEVNTVGWGASAYASNARLTGSTPSGSAFLRVNRSAAGDAYTSFTAADIPPANTPYTLSFWAWADSSITITDAMLFRTANSGSCCVNLATKAPQALTTTPTRVVLSGNTGSNPTGGLNIILRVTSTVGQNVYFDGFIITQGTTVHNFADGSSPGWLWNGTVSNSTSTGPPL